MGQHAISLVMSWQSQVNSLYITTPIFQKQLERKECQVTKDNISNEKMEASVGRGQHKHDILAKLCAGKQAEYGDTRVRFFFFFF